MRQHIDKFINHSFWGFLIFILVLGVIFQSTFWLGTYPMQWIEWGIEQASKILDGYISEGPLKDLIINGVIGGVGGVVVFIPNILILYFFISLMEESGYMARASRLMTKSMQRIGLHGKSFIPLVMGFGCNVPAIMAAGSIENRSSRLLTILINPFISCSARLPVYVLFAGTFFPNHAGLVLLGIYFIGIIMAIVTARLFRSLFFEKDCTDHTPTLPPYHLPSLGQALRMMWEKAWQYISKMGGVILIASLVVWFLSYYPQSSGDVSPSEQQKNSYIGSIGRWVEPVIAPLGFNWKVGISLLSGVAAKELIVSSLGVLYSEEGKTTQGNLSQELKSINPSTGKPDFTPAVALSFMVFVLLYFPCIASLTAISSETGSAWWALFSIVYNTTLAWGIAYIVYQLSNLFLT